MDTETVNERVIGNVNFTLFEGFMDPFYHEYRVIDTTTDTTEYTGTSQDCYDYARAQYDLWGFVHFRIVPVIHREPLPVIARTATEEKVRYYDAHVPYIEYVLNRIAYFASKTGDARMSLETAKSLSPKSSKTHSPHKEPRKAYASELDIKLRQNPDIAESARLQAVLDREAVDNRAYVLVNISSLLPIRKGTKSKLLPFVSKAKDAGKLHKVRVLRADAYESYIKRVESDGWEVIDKRSKSIIVRGLIDECKAFLNAESANDAELLDNVLVHKLSDTFTRSLHLNQVR